MEQPIQISFRNMDASEAVESNIRERIARLATLYGRIQWCRVVVEAPHRHHRQGKKYRVSVELAVPGGTLVANREPGLDGAHEDVYVAVRDAFDAARRRLEAFAQRHRGETKSSERAPRGRVLRVFPDAGYGFLEAPDGREIYFNRNSVLNDRFADLAPGVEVDFAEEQGERGAQASTVRVGAHAQHAE